MDLLNQSLILLLVAIAPWPGLYLHKLAPGEVAYAKKALSYLLAALIALASYLALDFMAISGRLIASVVVLIAMLNLPVYVAAGVSGIACALALINSDLTSVGLLIISGIVLGSLHPKKDVIAYASAACFIPGLLAMFLL